MPVGRGFVVRVAEPADEPALAILERAAPDSGHVALYLCPRLGYLDLASRYPGVTGFVATDPGHPGLIGMLFSSVAPTQLNGAVVPGAYLFSLRVNPAARRRGVATALIKHALERARDEAGVKLAWAALMAGNEPSARTFIRAGFAPVRDLSVRVRLPGGPRRRRQRAWRLRRASGSDLPKLADALNRANAGHNLWRPCTTDSLAAQLRTAAHDLADVALVEGRNGRILAAGAVFDVRRAFALHSVELRGLPRLLNRALSTVATRAPMHPLLVRHRALFETQPEAAHTLLTSLPTLQSAWPSVILAPIDPADPTWPVVTRATQLGHPLHIMSKSTVPLDEHRPIVLC